MHKHLCTQMHVQDCKSLLQILDGSIDSEEDGGERRPGLALGLGLARGLVESVGELTLE